MSNPSPPEPPTNRKLSPDFDELVAIIVAFGSIGLILFWVLGKNNDGFSFENSANSLSASQPTTTQELQPRSRQIETPDESLSTTVVSTPRTTIDESEVLPLPTVVGAEKKTIDESPLKILSLRLPQEPLVLPPKPQLTPTPTPEAAPTPVTTASPTAKPEAAPTPVTTASPTAKPEAAPTPVTTASPTAKPEAAPTPVTTASPTAKPEAAPTPVTTASPT
ncbi:MAG: hypothetical protein F6K10_14925, partial [Moorea sp. SIO2B7]|nr:hypothetical protein [Moorena sp. SIO2B7]